MPEDLYLMAMAVVSMLRGRLCGACFEAAHLRARSNQVAALRELVPCCANVEQRMMQRVEVAAWSISTAFNEHMRQFHE